MSNVGKHQGFRNNSGSLAMFAAIRRASFFLIHVNVY